MVQKELYAIREDGVTLYRTYSDERRYLQQEQTGAIYAEAIDVEDSDYTYVETELFLPEEPEEETEDETEEAEEEA